MRSATHQTWRRSLTQKLQDSYGLPKEEARSKVDGWLQWLNQGAESTGEPGADGASEVASSDTSTAPASGE
jgi:hypothetical protein